MKRGLGSGGYLIIRETHQDVQTEPQRTDMYIHHWVAEVDSALNVYCLRSRQNDCVYLGAAHVLS